MYRRAQDRIRTYYYKTKDDLTKLGDMPRSTLQNLLNELQTRLKLCKYQGHLFDRGHAGGDTHLSSLCDATGSFLCQGRWDKSTCLYHPIHAINPYTSREERIIFQTWNLDHTKERSRSVVPAIRTALLSNSKHIRDRDDNANCSLDYKAIFNDLFTVHNMKFVHIVCHDKGAHTTQIAGPYVIE